MSVYIKLSTLEYPRHEGDIRLEHPEITQDQTGDTFPCPDTYAPVEATAPPSFVEVIQKVIEGLPECVDGVWRTTWEVVDATPEDIAADPINELDQIAGSAPDVIA